MSERAAQQRFLQQQTYRRLHFYILRAAALGLTDVQQTKTIGEKEAQYYLADSGLMSRLNTHAHI